MLVCPIWYQLKAGGTTNDMSGLGMDIVVKTKNVTDSPINQYFCY